MRAPAPRRTGVRLLTVLALVAVSVTSTAAEAAAGSRPHQTRVAVQLSGNAVDVQPEVDGRVLTFDVSTASATGGSLQVFKPKPGSTLADVLGPLRVQLGLDAASNPALSRSTRDLTRTAEWFGGLDVFPDRPASFTVRLDGGTYYLIDLAPSFGPDPRLGPIATIDVTGDGSGSQPDADVRIEMRGTQAEDHDGVAGHGHEFRAPASMPASGVVEVRNQDEVIHFMVLEPLQPGTTRQDIADLLLQPPPDPDDPAPDPGPSLKGPGTGLR